MISRQTPASPCPVLLPPHPVRRRPTGRRADSVHYVQVECTPHEPRDGSLTRTLVGWHSLATPAPPWSRVPAFQLSAWPYGGVQEGSRGRSGGVRVRWRTVAVIGALDKGQDNAAPGVGVLCCSSDPAGCPPGSVPRCLEPDAHLSRKSCSSDTHAVQASAEKAP